MACVTVTSLVRTLEIEFLQSQPRPIVVENELISGNKVLIESLCEKLGSLMEQYDEYRMDGIEAIEPLESKLRDLASGVEDEIEFLVAHLYEGNSQLCQKETLNLHHTLQQAIKDINHIEEELVKVKNTIDRQGRNMALDEVIMMGDSSQHASRSEDLMIEKHDEFENIKELLIERASNQQKVVSIKGMGGIGKTTLAKRVYGDSSIVSYFDMRAWVVASQHHNKRQMLVDLLKSMGSNAESCDSDADLALRLRQSLLGQRYLVVMDDVWSREAWDAAKACFPDNRNGSRVLLTTRLEEVANYISSNDDFSRQVPFLDQRESWNLFHEKALLNGRCSGAEFETIGRPIVAKCGGLPLAIILAAGLFSKLNTLGEWKNIAEALNSSATTTIAEACSRTLSLSYNHLPHNLRACFLYLGVFPEDEDIYANNLARLWAAEGLVKAFRNESFEVVAHKHVQELCDRNLILVSKQSSNGRKIKTFRIHDVLHAFCVREAQKENLLKVVGGNGSNFYQKDFRWLSIQSSNVDAQVLRSSSKNCRSIFYFPKGKAPDLNLQNFNILRVLYTDDVKHNTRVGNFCNILHPVHLRYLSSYMVESFNSKPFSLWNIQTLAGVHFHHFLDFPHLCYYNCNQKSMPNLPKFVNQNLQNISGMHPSCCTKELSAKIPYLKKLDFVFPRASSEDSLNCIGSLAYFQHLESLKILFAHLKYPLNNQIALLKSLKKLFFFHNFFRWEDINILSTLPRLEVLRLSYYACVGPRWKLREEEKFCELIFLEIDGLTLKHWEVSGDNFPKLERLKLDGCKHLKEIPNSFADILTLKSIKLCYCLPSAVTSAKQIQEEQHDQGNYNMVVIEKNTIQKVVIKLEVNKSKARQIAKEFPGVVWTSLEGEEKDELVVEGRGFDEEELVRKLRDEIGGAHIKSDDQE